jgi:hypothetical protein
MGFSNRNMQVRKIWTFSKETKQKKMKKTYVKFCWEFNVPNSKVLPTHSKSGGRYHFNHKNKSSTNVK